MRFSMSRNPGYALIARIFDRVLPKAPDFFHMLATQSAKVAETAELLVRFMQTNSAELAAQINADEHAADDIKVANIHILNEAFSTPIDREDIYRAITNLDEIVNYCKDTVNEMAALEVEPDRFTQGMAELLLVGASALRKGFGRLGKHTAAASDDAEVARKAERAIDYLYRDALAALFQGDNYIQMFKKREIYRHLTNAAERMAHCASTLHDIVVKMV